jgi:hypothetical protein
MKIGVVGLAVPEGKVKYRDPILEELERKFEPKKVAPYFVEFVFDPQEFPRCDAFAAARDKVLDLLIVDMEKLETRLERKPDAPEEALIRKCIPFLEAEKPLCDVPLEEAEREILAALSPLSFKPTFVVAENSLDVNDLIRGVMDKANVSFFYTAGKPEVHAWFIPKGVDIVTCAGKIHTDLARGFIKGEIVNIVDYRNCHNLQDARAKGAAKLVDRDYIIQEGDVIEIRFNV